MTNTTSEIEWPWFCNFFQHVPVQLFEPFAAIQESSSRVGKEVCPNGHGIQELDIDDVDDYRHSSYALEAARWSVAKFCPQRVADDG